MKISYHLIIVLLLSALAASSCGNSRPLVIKPLSEATLQEIAVRATSKVHIAPFGTDAGSQRFALALEQELSDQGFTVVNDPKTADLILSGVFEQVWRIDRIQTNAALRGTTKSGERVWGGNFPPAVFLYPSNDQTKRLVVSIVNQLRNDVDELQKKYK